MKELQIIIKICKELQKIGKNCKELERIIKNCKELKRIIKMRKVEHFEQVGGRGCRLLKTPEPGQHSHAKTTRQNEDKINNQQYP